jgi:hypothetical protein
MTERPTVIGLILCEQIIVEAQTNNVSFINCFTRRRAEQFPTEPQKFAVAALLTDGEGPVTIKVKIVRLADEELIYEQERLVQFPNRLQQVRFLLRVTACAFPTPGHYEVQLSADNELLALNRLNVFQGGPP